MPVNGADELGLEILRGCHAISKAIGETERRTFSLLNAGILPAWKEIGVWTTTKERLQEHYLRKSHPKRTTQDNA